MLLFWMDSDGFDIDFQLSLSALLQYNIYPGKKTGGFFEDNVSI